MGRDLWGLKRQHDTVAWHSRRDKFFSNTAFRPIMLNPDLLLANINVHDAAMNTIRSIPPGVDQFIVIVRFIKDHFNLYFTARRAVLRVVANQLLDNFSVLLHSFHLTMAPCCGSNARQAMVRSSITGRAIGSSRILTKTL